VEQSQHDLVRVNCAVALHSANKIGETKTLCATVNSSTHMLSATTDPAPLFLRKAPFTTLLDLQMGLDVRTALKVIERKVLNAALNVVEGIQQHQSTVLNEDDEDDHFTEEDSEWFGKLTEQLSRFATPMDERGISIARLRVLREYKVLTTMLNVIKHIWAAHTSSPHRKSPDVNEAKGKYPALNAADTEDLKKSERKDRLSRCVNCCFKVLRKSMLDAPENQLFVSDVKVLRQSILDAPENQLFVSGVRVLLKCVGSGGVQDSETSQELMSCVTMLLNNRHVQSTKIGDSVVDDFVRKLRDVPYNIVALKLLAALCTCQGQACPKNQLMLADKLIGDSGGGGGGGGDSSVLVQISVHEKDRVRFIYPQEQSLPAGWELVKEVVHDAKKRWNSLKNVRRLGGSSLFRGTTLSLHQLIEKSKTPNDKHVMFLRWQLYLYAKMCHGRNYYTREKVARVISLETIFVCVKDDGLDSSLRAALARLALIVYIDCEPHLPRLRNNLFIRDEELHQEGIEVSPHEKPHEDPYHKNMHEIIQMDLQPDTHEPDNLTKTKSPVREQLLTTLNHLIDFKFYDSDERAAGLDEMVKHILTRLQKLAKPQPFDPSTGKLLTSSLNTQDTSRRHTLFSPLKLIHPKKTRVIHPEDGLEDESPDDASQAPLNPAKEAAFKADAKVKVNFQGKGKHYPGKIVRICEDGTYEVLYDDGERESRVAEAMIQLAQRTLREIIFDEKKRKQMLRILESTLMMVIILLLVFLAVILGFVAPVENPHPLYAVFDEFAFWAFALELLCRIWAVADLCEFMKNPFAVMDLIVVLLDVVMMSPSIKKAMGPMGSNTKALRIVRLARLARLQRMMRLMKRMREQMMKSTEVPVWRLPQQYVVHSDLSHLNELQLGKLKEMLAMTRVVNRTVVLSGRFKLLKLLARLKNCKFKSITDVMKHEKSLSGRFKSITDVMKAEQHLSGNHVYGMIFHLVMYQYAPLVQEAVGLLMSTHVAQEKLRLNIIDTQLLETKAEQDEYLEIEAAMQDITRYMDHAMAVIIVFDTDEDGDDNDNDDNGAIEPETTQGYEPAKEDGRQKLDAQMVELTMNLHKAFTELTKKCRVDRSSQYSLGGRRYNSVLAVQKILANLELDKLYAKWRSLLSYPDHLSDCLAARCCRRIYKCMNSLMESFLQHHPGNQSKLFHLLPELLQDLNDGVTGVGAVIYELLLNNLELVNLLPEDFARKVLRAADTLRWTQTGGELVRELVRREASDALRCLLATITGSASLGVSKEAHRAKAVMLSLTDELLSQTNKPLMSHAVGIVKKLVDGSIGEEKEEDCASDEGDEINNSTFRTMVDGPPCSLFSDGLQADSEGSNLASGSSQAMVEFSPGAAAATTAAAAATPARTAAVRKFDNLLGQLESKESVSAELEYALRTLELATACASAEINMVEARIIGLWTLELATACASAEINMVQIAEINMVQIILTEALDMHIRIAVAVLFAESVVHVQIQVPHLNNKDQKLGKLMFEWIDTFPKQLDAALVGMRMLTFENPRGTMLDKNHISCRYAFEAIIPVIIHFFGHSFSKGRGSYFERKLAPESMGKTISDLVEQLGQIHKICKDFLKIPHQILVARAIDVLLPLNTKQKAGQNAAIDAQLRPSEMRAPKRGGNTRSSPRSRATAGKNNTPTAADELPPQRPQSSNRQKFFAAGYRTTNMLDGNLQHALDELVLDDLDDAGSENDCRREGAQEQLRTLSMEAQKMDVNALAQEEHETLLSYLCALPSVNDPVSDMKSKECGIMRLEPLLHKLVAHIRSLVQYQHDRRVLSTEHVPTTVWILQLLRRMIEYKWGNSSEERDNLDKKESEDADAKAQDLQDVLNGAKVPLMCIDLVAKGLDRVVINEAMKLLVAMLFREGGNLKVQEAVHHHLNCSFSTPFFTEARGTLIRMGADGMPGERENTKRILHMLQLMCEGHYKPNQDLVREQLLAQSHGGHNINLLDTMSMTFENQGRKLLEPGSDPYTYETMQLLAELICEVIQGPCEGNQEHFVEKTNLLETMNRLMRLECQEVNFDDGRGEVEVIEELKTTVLAIFRALLEGQGNGQSSMICERILSVLHLEVLQLHLDPPKIDFDHLDPAELEEALEKQDEEASKPLRPVQVGCLVLFGDVARIQPEPVEGTHFE
jgi:hypothetical protein